jgi:hypothetical protein
MAKLKQQDLEELKKRRELMNGYILIYQALDLQLAAWMNMLFQKEGLDLSKKYEVNLQDGTVVEVSVKEEKKDEPSGDKASS